MTGLVQTVGIGLVRLAGIDLLLLAGTFEAVASFRLHHHAFAGYVAAVA